ncbi:MAG: hypothetical protein WC650_04165 [Candidatus Doudnabacteria bacterium]
MKKLIEKLKAFSIQAKKFGKHMHFFQNIKAEIKFEQNRKAVVKLFGVNEETLIAVLVHFRNFYMKISALYFVAIVEAILKEAELSSYWKLAKDFLSAWNKLLDPNYDSFGGMLLNMDKNQLSVKRNLDLWMNEGYLHVDQYKPGSYKGLDAIKSQHVFEALSRIGMVDSLQKLCGLVIAFNAQVVEKILAERS